MLWYWISNEINFIQRKEYYYHGKPSVLSVSEPKTKLQAKTTGSGNRPSSSPSLPHLALEAEAADLPHLF